MASPSFFSRFKSGDVIFNENDPGNEMFIIEQGKIEIFRTIDGQESVLAELEQGDFFGEMALLESLPRVASARAMIDCKVLQIDRSTFDQMLRQNPEIAVRMLRKLSGRLRSAQASSAEVIKSAAAAIREAEVARKAAEDAVRTAPSAAPVEASPIHTAASPEPERETQKASARKTRKMEVQEEPEAEQPRERTIAKMDKPSRFEREATPAIPAPPVIARPPSPGTLCDGNGNVLFTLNPGPESTVGRFDSVTGIRPDVDLTDLDTSRSTSRKHAKIIREDGHLYVFEEAGTANGTFVNGKRIKTGVRTEFQDGDQLRFGAVKLEVKL